MKHLAKLTDKEFYALALILTALVLVLTSCGSGNGSSIGGSSEEGSQSKSSETTFSHDGASFYVTSKDDLKSCNESTARQLVYVEEDSKFYTCSVSKKEWVEVTIKGEKGEDGSDGKDGANGKDGSTGKDGSNSANQIASIFNCGLFGDGSGVGVDHATATVYKNGYVELEAFFFGSTSFRHESCGAISNGNSISCNTTSYSSVPWQVSFDKSAGRMNYKNNGYTGRNTDQVATCTRVDF